MTPQQVRREVDRMALDVARLVPSGHRITGTRMVDVPDHLGVPVNLGMLGCGGASGSWTILVAVADRCGSLLVNAKGSAKCGLSDSYRLRARAPTLAFVRAGGVAEVRLVKPGRCLLLGVDAGA